MPTSTSLVSNAYLDEASVKIRARPVPWQGWLRAQLITTEELTLLQKVDRQPKARTESILKSDGKTYALLYLRLLKKLQPIDAIQCILVLIADALTDHEERVPLFTKTAETDPELPYGPMLRILEMSDEFSQLKAAQIITVFLSSEPSPLPQHQMTPFLIHMASFVQGSSQNKRDVAVQCLEALLARRECRAAVWMVTGITAGLIEILRRKCGPQLSYEIGYCLWLLSFEQEVAGQINKRHDVIPLLVDVAQTAVKEKVIRVIVAIFRNLVIKAPEANLPAMLVAKLLPLVKYLGTRKWSDEDVMEDIQFLKDELTLSFQSLTTYDEYTSELASGHLSWTPVHESDDFWKEHAAKLNDKDYEQLKILIKLLKESTDPIVLAVAAHDIGQYVKHYERGKKIVTDLGAKARVMELMSHVDSDVRYRALQSVYQLVSHPWVSV